MKNTIFPVVQAGDSKWVDSFFIDLLNDIYSAEKAFEKAIPSLIEHSVSEELVDSLIVHLEVSKRHIFRIEEVFIAITEMPVARKCLQVADLIRESAHLLKSAEPGLILDSEIILIAKKLEEYEIETYRTLCSLSKAFDNAKVSALLEETLAEETEAKERLILVAELLMHADVPEFSH